MSILDFFNKSAKSKNVVDTAVNEKIWGFISLYSSPSPKENMLFNIYEKSTDLRAWIRDKNNLMFKYWYYLEDKEWDKINEWELFEKVNKILNFQYDFKRFVKKWNLYANISGYVFILKLRNKFWDIIWLDVLDSRDVQVVTNDDWSIKEYVQRWKNWTKTFYPEDIYTYIRDENPDDEYRWTSPLLWAITDVLADDQAARVNYNFFFNNAMPLTLLLLEKWVTPAQSKTLLKQLSWQFAGWKNKWKIWMLPWVKEIIQLEDKFQDMQFTIMRKFTTEKVLSAIGVPTIRVNKVWDIKYSNSEQAYKQYIDATIRPEEQDLLKCVNDILDERFLWEIKVNYVDNHIIDEKSKYELQKIQIESWTLTVNEARKDNWKEEYDEEKANKPLISNSLIELDKISWTNSNENLNSNNEQANE